VAVSRALRRLLRVLNIEEEQCRLALESAIGDLRLIERAYAATSDQARSGRQLVVNSAHTGELPDRLAGLEETHSAKRRAVVLAPRLAKAESEVDERRQAFLAKRVECRQAETLIREAEAKDALIAGRRSQQGLDDWFLNRRHGRRGTPQSPQPVPCEDPSDLPDAGLAKDLNPGFSPDLSGNLP
jgi:flagellar biosynthesis chaperone FliJ